MHLFDCFVDLVAYVSHSMGSAENFPTSGESLRRTVSDLIVQSETFRETFGFDKADYESARFAVFAWIDETVMKSSFEGKEAWKRQLLQRAFYNTTRGGVEFYRRFEDLDEDKMEVREIYYLCLALGFSGRYGLSEEDGAFRDRLMDQQFKRLTGSSGLFSKASRSKLFPAAYGLVVPERYEKRTVRKRSMLMTALLGVGPVVLFAFLYALYRFILNNEIMTKVVQ
jgi:type VI secretion system protein ImpK